MGAYLATDLRKSFAIATGGPSDMAGKRTTEGTLVLQDYVDCEDRAAEAKASADRRARRRGAKAGKSDEDKPSSKKFSRKRKNADDGPKGSGRKRKRKPKRKRDDADDDPNEPEAPKRAKVSLHSLLDCFETFSTLIPHKSFFQNDKPGRGARGGRARGRGGRGRGRGRGRGGYNNRRQGAKY